MVVYTEGLVPSFVPATILVFFLLRDDLPSWILAQSFPTFRDREKARTETRDDPNTAHKKETSDL